MAENGSENRNNVKNLRETKYVDKKDIIHFPEGLPGFEEFTDFIIFDIKDCKPFKSMLSVKEGGPDFVVVDPFLIFKDYSPVYLSTYHEKLDLEEPTELAVLSIVTLAETPADMTVNLRGPILLNFTTRHAKQVVLPDDCYSTRVTLAVRQ